MLSNIILYQPNKQNKKNSLGPVDEAPVDEAVPADNDDEMANVAPIDVALLGKPAHNNVCASFVDGDALNSVGLNATVDADGTLEDDSLASDEVEFERDMGVVAVSSYCHFIFIL